MKKLISMILIVILAMNLRPGCIAESAGSDVPDFKGLNDPSLTSYIEDTLYSELIDSLGSEDYFVENVKAVYISQEYLDEVAYNSRANIFFGYTLAELDEQFQGEKYIFTRSDNGETTVEGFEEYYDDIYDKIIRNVAIGTGVILVCVTVSALTAGAAPAVSIIFSIAAKSGVTVAIESAKFGAVTSSIVTYIQTRDLDETLKSAFLGASEGFKFGALAGALRGGVSEASFLREWSKLTTISWRDAALIQRESKYSLDFIKTVHSIEEYNVYKQAGLVEYNINNTRVLLPKDFNINFVDPKTGRTNLQLMKEGYNPIYYDESTYNWHHVGQKMILHWHCLQNSNIRIIITYCIRIKQIPK